MMAALPTGVSRSKAAWQPLIDALRDELQEFGGLIRLLNEEQDAILGNPSGVADVPDAIERQRKLAFASTQIRRGLMTVPGSDGRHVPASAFEIVDSAPDEIHPLLEALFSEVERLALRAGEHASENDRLRRRAPMLATTMAARKQADAERGPAGSCDTAEDLLANG